jgi:antitoxin (DNA-binding transcriptional repressor) of toxin-antitoxin stability system
MITQIEVAWLGPASEALVDELANNGGEISLTREGKTIAKLVGVESAPSDAPSNERVFYDGRWMSAAGAERERSMEHLRGTIKILGDIVAPIDDVEYDALK